MEAAVSLAASSSAKRNELMLLFVEAAGAPRFVRTGEA
jgi:hypothetical protein